MIQALIIKWILKKGSTEFLLFIGEYLEGAFNRPAKSAASPIESSDEFLLKYLSDAASNP